MLEESLQTPGELQDGHDMVLAFDLLSTASTTKNDCAHQALL